MADTVTQLEIDQRVFDLYDEYCHGRIDHREFLRLAALVAGGLAMAQALLPRYAEAQTISFADTRIKAQYVTYPSPGGRGAPRRGRGLRGPRSRRPLPGRWLPRQRRRRPRAAGRPRPDEAADRHAEQREPAQGAQALHNNSTPRYHEVSAKLAWDRTIAFFKKHLA